MDPQQPVDGIATEMPDVRTIPLGRLAATKRSALRRVLPDGSAPKPPVAAFDSAM
jgi:FXSXX-COOH protein